jgi:hypothetical protein
MAGAKTHSHFKRAFENVQPTMPLLARASIDEADPEFLLVLSTRVEEHGLLNAYFFGLTLGIVPLFLHSDVIVGATLQTAEGENLISHQSVSEARGVAQILLLPLLPWTLTHPLEEEIYVDPMRSALAALETDFAYLRSHASPRSRSSAARQETTE